MKWKKKSKSTTPVAAVVGSGAKSKQKILVSGKKIIVVLGLVVVGVATSYWFFIVYDGSESQPADSNIPKDSVAAETAAVSVEGLSDEEKHVHYVGLAHSYEAINEYEKAGESFEKATEFTDDDTLDYVQAANNYHIAGNASKASKNAKNALESIDKSKTEDFEQIGDLYGYVGNSAEAKVYYEKSKNGYMATTELDGDISKEDIIKRIDAKIQKLDE